MASGWLDRMISHGFAIMLAFLLSFALLGIQLVWSLIQWHQMQKAVYRMLRRKGTA